MHYHSGDIIVQAYRVHDVLSDMLHCQLQRLADWVAQAADRGQITASLRIWNRAPEFVFIQTLNGTVKGFDGDWIVRHDGGNLSHWNDDPFKAMWKPYRIELQMVGGPYDGRIIEHPNKQFPEAEIGDHFCLIWEDGSTCFHYFRIGETFKYLFRPEQKSDPHNWPKHVVHPNSDGIVYLPGQRRPDGR